MTAHIVIDLQSFAHLACELPWWREKCKHSGVHLHAIVLGLVPSSTIPAKAVRRVQCSTSPRAITDPLNEPVYSAAEALANDPSVGHVLVCIATDQRRFAGLIGHEKVTLCSCEHDVLPIWWPGKLLGMRTLAHMGWRHPVAWRKPVAWSGPPLVKEPLGVEKVEENKRAGAPQMRRPPCETPTRAPASASPKRSTNPFDDEDGDEEEAELAHCLRGSACRRDLYTFHARSVLADGRFVVPC